MEDFDDEEVLEGSKTNNRPEKDVQFQVLTEVTNGNVGEPSPFVVDLETLIQDLAPGVDTKDVVAEIKQQLKNMNVELLDNSNQMQQEELPSDKQIGKSDEVSPSENVVQPSKSTGTATHAEGKNLDSTKRHSKPPRKEHHAANNNNAEPQNL